MSNANGERRILYWILGAMFALIMAGLGWHTQHTANSLQRLEDRLDRVLLEQGRLRDG